MSQPADPGQSPPEAAASSKSRLEDNVQPLKVTPEQDKLLESALRIKIMHTLSGEPLTSKQVAGKLNKTPGNIHYHIVKLYEGGLLELVRTENADLIVSGGYGHSRLGEWIFGGVTQELLASSPVCCMLSH